jgi:flagellar biosynthesis protein FliQ
LRNKPGASADQDIAMTDGDVAAMMRGAMLVMLQISGPLLLVALVVGLLMSLLQAITQINEATLAFVPKILALGLTLMLLGPFILATLSGYAHLLFDRIVAIGGS